MKPRLAPCVLALALTSCGNATETERCDSVVGTWSLVAVNDRDLPLVMDSGATLTSTLDSARYRFDATTYGSDWHYRDASNGVVSPRVRSVSGTYTGGAWGDYVLYVDSGPTRRVVSDVGELICNLLVLHDPAYTRSYRLARR